MKIIDTFNEIKKCYKEGKFDIESWEAYANYISPSFKDKIKNDVKDYNFHQDILPILQLLINSKDKFIMAHNSFIDVTEGLEEKINDKLGIELDVILVFYLGLCNGAGWATKVDGKSTILLGVEKIVELSWCDKRNIIALIYHELGHIWHFQVRKETSSIETMKDKALWQLYTEGIAMYIEQLLCDDIHFYHQDTNGWLNWCNQNRKLLYEKYINRIDKDESVQQFFGDWCDFEGKSDVGYYLGCELIKSLSEKYSLIELANIKLLEIEYQLRKMI